MAASTGVTIGEINRQGSASIPFFLSCNSNFYVSVSSQNGGLSHKGGQQKDTAFTTLIPYTMALQVGGASLAGTCKSDRMVGLSTSCVGAGAAAPAAAGNNATIALQWNLQDRSPVAGVYQDVLTVTVSPRL